MNPNNSAWHTRGGKRNGGKPPWFRKTSKASSSSGSAHSKKSELLKYVVETKPVPYQGWRLYFRDEAFTEWSTTHRKVSYFEEFLRRHKHAFPLDKIEESRAFTVDLRAVNQDAAFLAQWPDFAGDLDTNGKHTLNCLGLAMHEVLVCHRRVQPVDGELEPVSLAKVHARIVNHEPILHLKHLKVNCYGKLVSVRGTVIRVSNVILVCRWMAFECVACRGQQVLKQPDGVYTVPTRCDTSTCQHRTRFVPLLSSPHTRTDNWQVLKLQELVGSDQGDGGRIPRTVECELTGDLVKTCNPGDDITVTGIIKVRDTEESGGARNKQASIFLLYLSAVSIVNNKSQTQAANGAAGLEFSLQDYYAIQKIQAEPALFRLLVHSLCPSIYGHEMIKAGLVLGLFGGTVGAADTRADPHILLVGDPGQGKSQMLHACSNVAPKGVFVCGNTSTSAGLTVTMTRESGGEYALEAGALVLADRGCCCIDEFDKMPAHHSALLEAMEQQTVSIVKAGVACTLPARTSILAAANPAAGHYNQAKPVAENLRFSGALLSRFDLVFILRDRPNKVLDSLLSEHVLAGHSALKPRNSSARSVCSNTLSLSSEAAVPLQDDLKLFKGEEMDVLPHQLLRKYIAYARKYVHPVLSPEAANVLKGFYLELRKRHLIADGTPITTRQAHSLIRLTSARAKLELRELATEKDARDVIEIVKYSLVDTFSDEHDSVDFKRLQNGAGMSQRSKVKAFIGLLQRRAEVEGRSEFTIGELKDVAQTGGICDDFYNLLNTLNLHGYLLKKATNMYKLLSAD